MIAILFAVAAIAYIALSPSHDFVCDAGKRVERERSGQSYWCLVSAEAAPASSAARLFGPLPKGR